MVAPDHCPDNPAFYGKRQWLHIARTGTVVNGANGTRLSARCRFCNAYLTTGDIGCVWGWAWFIIEEEPV